jgi:hypothetical protein
VNVNECMLHHTVYTAGAKTLAHLGKDSADMVLAVTLHHCKLVPLLCDAKTTAVVAVRVVLLVVAVGVLTLTHQMQTGGVVPMASLVVTMRCVACASVYTMQCYDVFRGAYVLQYRLHCERT